MIAFDFFLPPTNKTDFIVVKITKDKEVLCNIRTPLLMDPDQWDLENQCPQNIYLKHGKRINRSLNRLKIELTEYFKKNSQKPAKLSVKSIKSCIKKSCDSFEDYKKNTFLYHVYSYIKSRKHLISHSTYQRYCVFLRLLERYESGKMKYLEIRDIKDTFVSDFISFGAKEKYNTSTIYRTVNFVKTILHFLERKGIRTFFYEVELPKVKKEKKIITFTIKELNQIKQTNVSCELKAAKDWLLISCYTGQRVSDFMNFDVGRIKKIEGKDFLSFTQQKTNKDLLLPIHPEVCKILQRNNFNFPKKISIRMYNEQIKEIARLAGINNTISFNKRETYRATCQNIPKWQAISSHIGRRSFASNFYGKIPTALLMEATGHSTEQMFQKYINAFDPSRVLALHEYFKKLYKQNVTSARKSKVYNVHKGVTC